MYGQGKRAGRAAEGGPADAGRRVGPPGRNGIVSLDGGGVRGIFQAELLAEIHRRIGFLDHVGLYAGTSTGAIIAVSLAVGIEPEDLVQLYRRLGPKVFACRRGPVARLLGRSTYRPDGLRAVLASTFGTARFRRCATRTLVAAVCLETCQPVLLDSRDPHDGKLAIVDVLLASTSAPVFFPPHYIAALGEHFMDGGLACENPSYEALSVALRAGGATPAQLRLLSVGNGRGWKAAPALRAARRTPWSQARETVGLCMCAGSALADHRCRAVFGRDYAANYLRVTPGHGGAIALDDYRAACDLLAPLAIQRAREAAPQIRAWCEAPVARDLLPVGGLS